MSKYSSDSDSYTEKRTSKKSYSRRSRERSYSSDSSSSRSKKRKEKKYKRDRSRSRGSDKYSRTRVDRSSSYQSKSYSSKSRYSNSPDRTRKRSNSRNRYKYNRRSKSRERSSRRSRSNSRTKYRKSRKSHSRDSSRHKDKSPSTSSSSSRTSVDKTKENQIEKSTKLVTDTIKTKLKKLSVLKNEEEKISTNILDEINDDSFAPKPFVSSKTNKKVTDNIVIDLKSQTIKVPDVEITEPDSIFHPNLFINEEARMEKWVKELYIYRQKAYNGELNII